MFFSVKKSLKLNGKIYIPCVCYEYGQDFEATVNKLVSEDKAVIYEERVFFQNGKPLPSLKEREAKAKAEKKARKEAEKKESKEE